MDHPASRIGTGLRRGARQVLRDRSLVVFRELRRASPLVTLVQVLEALLLCAVTVGGTVTAVVVVVQQGTSLTARATTRAADLASSGDLVPAVTRFVRTLPAAGSGSMSGAGTRLVEVSWTFDTVPHRKQVTELTAEGWHPAEEVEAGAGTELIWVDSRGAPVRAPQSPGEARVTAWSTAALGGLLVLTLTGVARWGAGEALVWCSAARWQREVDDWRGGHGSPGREASRS